MLHALTALIASGSDIISSGFASSETMGSVEGEVVFCGGVVMLGCVACDALASTCCATEVSSFGSDTFFSELSNPI